MYSVRKCRCHKGPGFHTCPWGSRHADVEVVMVEKLIVTMMRQLFLQALHKRCEILLYMKAPMFFCMTKSLKLLHTAM